MISTISAAVTEPLILAEDFTEQAGVTNWPERIALVAVMVGAIALALWGMRRGWQRRVRSQSAVSEPLALDDIVLDGDLDSRPDSVPGLYVGTSTAGQWLDRIAAHGLGVRSRAHIAVAPSGIALERHGARSFFIPLEDIQSVRVDRGVAGTVRGKDSVIIVTWLLGDLSVDTGFRADDGDDHRALLDGLMAVGLVHGERAEPGPDTQGEPGE